MYQPVNKLDVEQLQKWKTEANDNVSEIYDYFNKILDQVITMDVIKANADLKNGTMKIPLFVRMPKRKEHLLIEESLKIPNRFFYNRIGYCQYTTGDTYLVHQFNEPFFILHFFNVDEKIKKLENKIRKMTDKELDELIKNFQPKLPDEITSEYYHCHAKVKRVPFTYSEYGIYIKW